VQDIERELSCPQKCVRRRKHNPRRRNSRPRIAVLPSIYKEGGRKGKWRLTEECFIYTERKENRVAHLIFWVGEKLLEVEAFHWVQQNRRLGGGRRGPENEKSYTPNVSLKEGKRRGPALIVL